MFFLLYNWKDQNEAYQVNSNKSQKSLKLVIAVVSFVGSQVVSLVKFFNFIPSYTYDVVDKHSCCVHIRAEYNFVRYERKKSFTKSYHENENKCCGVEPNWGKRNISPTLSTYITWQIDYFKVKVIFTNIIELIIVLLRKHKTQMEC